MDLTKNQETARQILARLFGWASGNAADRVLALTDDETAAIAAAGQEHARDGDALRAHVKTVLTRAEERQRADGPHAQHDRNQARATLRQQLSLSADQAAAIEGRLNQQQRGDAAALANVHDSRAQLRAILGDELLGQVAALASGPAAAGSPIQ